jgi:hypothetical protein
MYYIGLDVHKKTITTLSPPAFHHNVRIVGDTEVWQAGARCVSIAGNTARMSVRWCKARLWG